MELKHEVYRHHSMRQPMPATDRFTTVQDDEHMRDELREMARIYRARGHTKLAAEVDALAVAVQKRMDRGNNVSNGSAISSLHRQQDQTPGER